MPKVSAPELEAALEQFIGSETWYRHSLARKIIYTDGVKYLAEAAGAYWLIDEVALTQNHRKVRGETFQVWTLRVLPNKKAILTCDDGNGNVVYSKEIEYTDFPLPEIKLYCTDGTILLPSEY